MALGQAQGHLVTGKLLHLPRLIAANLVRPRRCRSFGSAAPTEWPCWHPRQIVPPPGGRKGPLELSSGRRWIFVERGTAAPGPFIRGVPSSLRVTVFTGGSHRKSGVTGSSRSPVRREASTTRAKPRFRLSQAALAASSGPAVSIALIYISSRVSRSSRSSLSCFLSL